MLLYTFKSNQSTTGNPQWRSGVGGGLQTLRSRFDSYLRWLARKLSSSDQRTLLPKPLLLFFPSSSPLLVYSYLTIYIVLNTNMAALPRGCKPRITNFA